MQQSLQKNLIVGFIALLFIFAIHVREPLSATPATSAPFNIPP